MQVCVDILGGHADAETTYRIGDDIRERQECPSQVFLVDRCTPVRMPHAGCELVAGLDQVANSGVHQAHALNGAPALAVFVEAANGEHVDQELAGFHHPPARVGIEPGGQVQRLHAVGCRVRGRERCAEQADCDLDAPGLE